MAWKQDLAKLKQQLGPEAPSPAPRPVPAPKPIGQPALDDEDAIFLSAMGLRPSVPRPSKPTTDMDAPPADAVPDPPLAVTFQEALKDLKGLKPLAKGIQDKPSQLLPSPSAAIEPPRPSDVPASTPVLAAGSIIPTRLQAEPPPQPPIPLRFQLAAGMAIEVDGLLDLRSHSLSDAMERLKDRLADGVALGWRCFQVILGPDQALHEGLLAMLAAGEAPMVARYAQAPVPMGGMQAWLLYLTPPPALNT